MHAILLWIAVMGLLVLAAYGGGQGGSPIVFSGPATNEFALQFPTQDGARQQAPSDGSTRWEFVLHVQQWQALPCVRSRVRPGLPPSSCFPTLSCDQHG